MYLQRLDQTSYSLEEKWSKHKRQKDELEEQLEGALAQSAGGAAEELPPDPSDVSCVPPAPEVSRRAQNCQVRFKKDVPVQPGGEGGNHFAFFCHFLFFFVQHPLTYQYAPYSQRTDSLASGSTERASDITNKSRIYDETLPLPWAAPPHQGSPGGPGPQGGGDPPVAGGPARPPARAPGPLPPFPCCLPQWGAGS